VATPRGRSRVPAGAIFIVAAPVQVAKAASSALMPMIAITRFMLQPEIAADLVHRSSRQSRAKNGREQLQQIQAMTEPYSGLPDDRAAGRAHRRATPLGRRRRA